MKPKNEPLRLDFGRRLMLEVHDPKDTAEAGVSAYRELDDALGPTLTVGDERVDPRPGKNRPAGDEGLVPAVRLRPPWRLRGRERRPPPGPSGQWIDGNQEDTADNVHFGCSCYHPLFVFNRISDRKRCAWRLSKVHSAHGRHDVLEPMLARWPDSRSDTHSAIILGGCEKTSGDSRM